MSRKEERIRAVLEFYDARIAEEVGSEVLGWSSPASQHTRFEVLCEIADLDGTSVLDVGCGQGDLYGYLEDLGLAVDYRGADIHPGLIERARAAYPAGTFEVRDILADEAKDEVDWILCCGVFGLVPNGDQEFIDAMLTRMMALARRGVSVNFLSARTPNPKDPRSHYAEPVEMLELAMRLTPNVVLRHDYRPNDFTLWLRHAPPGAER